MSLKQLYYDITSNRFIYSATGAELLIKDYPVVSYEDVVSFEWHIGQWNTATGVFDHDDISTLNITSWKSSIDLDLNSTTAPMCRSLTGDIDGSRADEGIITVNYNTITTEFLAAVEDSEDGVRVHIDLKGYNASLEKVFYARPKLKQFIASAEVDPEADPPVIVQSNYYTSVQIDALIGDLISAGATVPENSVGANGNTFLKSDGAFYKKISDIWTDTGVNLKGATGATGPAGSNGTNGVNAYVYTAYASDDSGTDFTTTFNAALNYIAIKSTTTAIASPAVGDFTGLWKNYKGAPGVAGVGLAPKGAWVSGTNYALDDAVTYSGSLFDCILAVTDNSTDDPVTNSTHWLKIVSKGDTGAAGSNGTNGTNGSNAIGIYAVLAGTDLTVGDGVAYTPPLPSAMNGMNLSAVRISVLTAGTTNATTFQVHNVTDAVDMLSVAYSIASGATTGSCTIDTAHDDVATGDVFRIDCDSISTTAPKGLLVTLEFALP